MVRTPFGEPTKVLDHGHVHLLEVMGDDATIVESARTSIAGEKVRATREDRGLIRYLLRMAHTTPFEMVVFRFHCKMPIFVARQWIRHRMSSVNEMSGRYGVLPEEFYVPDREHIQFQAERNKQGRSTREVDEEVARSIQSAMREDARLEFTHYKNYLGEGRDAGGIGNPEIAHLAEHGGMVRELARINLPLSTYTQWVWKIDLHNLMHFLRLRLDAHAQYEIRVYAEAIGKIVEACCPLAWEAFEDFRLNAVTLSAQDVAALGACLQNLDGGKWLSDASADLGEGFKTKREAEEFAAKFRRILGAS